MDKTYTITITDEEIREELKRMSDGEIAKLSDNQHVIDKIAAFLVDDFNANFYENVSDSAYYCREYEMEG